MADHDDAAALGLHEVLQQLQPVDVQVVRRLVEQVQVVPGQQQRGQPHPRRLPARQRRRRQVQVECHAQVGHDRRHPVVEVGAAEGEPGLERLGVPVVGPVRLQRQLVRRGVHRRRRSRDPGTAVQALAHRLGVVGLALLAQVAHARRRRRERHGPALGSGAAGQDLEQRGLARAIGADEAHDVARADREVEPGEQRPVPVRRRQLPGDKHCAHRVGTLVHPIVDQGVGARCGSGSGPGMGTYSLINERTGIPTASLLAQQHGVHASGRGRTPARRRARRRRWDSSVAARRARGAPSPTSSCRAPRSTSRDAARSSSSRPSRSRTTSRMRGPPGCTAQPATSAIRSPCAASRAVDSRADVRSRARRAPAATAPSGSRGR